VSGRRAGGGEAVGEPCVIWDCRKHGVAWVGGRRAPGQTAWARAHLQVDARRDMKTRTNAEHEKHSHKPSEARRGIFQVQIMLRNLHKYMVFDHSTTPGQGVFAYALSVLIGQGGVPAVC